MPPSSSMRQIGVKNVGFKIEIMKWNNRMDLLAFSNDKGEVIVQRLSWQKILTHPPPADGIKVRGLDWRNDEKILAIGYSNGKVIIFDIESQLEIHSFVVDDDITYLGWTQNSLELCEDRENDEENILNCHDTYLPSLPSFNSLSSTARRSDYSIANSYSRNVLNLLKIGLKSGCLHLSVFGVLPCGTIDVAHHIKRSSTEFQIIDAKMSASFREIFILIKIDSILKILTFENDTFPKYSLPLLSIATKHGQILSTMSYIEDIIQCITEAWETALLEMDNKLTKYASAQPPGTLSADFLQLLMFGDPTDSLALLLSRELTEKELKKLGNSIEICYSTIQKLVIKPLHNGILNICYHLNCVRGLSRNTFYYKPIFGKPTNQAIQNAGAFLIKSLELQLTIDQSTRDYKIFWSWLYSVIIRLMEEAVPDDIAAVSQQDVMYLAEFLNNFDPMEDETAPRKKFNLEQVGQYLENKNLDVQCKVDLKHNWDKLLNENECLATCDAIYPHHKELSLVQQHNLLKKSIEELFSKPEQLISERFQLKTTMTCLELTSSGNDTVITDGINIEEEDISYFCGLISGKVLFYLEFNSYINEIKVIKLEFLHKPFFMEKHQNAFGKLTFKYVQFYNEEILSMLLNNEMDTNRSTSCFIQFPLAQLRPRMTILRMQDSIDFIKNAPITNMFEILDTTLVKNIDGYDWQTFSVSGNRKVAALLSESQKRIRLYEMEVEEDEDEVDMSQNNSLDISRESNETPS